MRTRWSVVAAICLMAVSLLACSPAASQSPTSAAPNSASPDADAALIDSVCADATWWRNCVRTMTAALDMLAGELVALCQFDGEEGGLQVIHNEDEAATACSSGTPSETPPPGAGSFPAGRVVRVIQLP